MIWQRKKECAASGNVIKRLNSEHSSLKSCSFWATLSVVYTKERRHSTPILSLLHKQRTALKTLPKYRPTKIYYDALNFQSFFVRTLTYQDLYSYCLFQTLQSILSTRRTFSGSSQEVEYLETMNMTTTVGLVCMVQDSDSNLNSNIIYLTEDTEKNYVEVEANIDMIDAWIQVQWV